MAIQFQPYDAVYFYCVGDSVTFDTAWRVYCSIDRICFSDQCDDPEFSEHRDKMIAAVQRGIGAGLILVTEGRTLSQSPDLRSRFDQLRSSGLNEFDASEEVGEYLQSKSWPVVCENKFVM